MSEIKPGYQPPYNPDGLSEAELRADDAKIAAAQKARMDKLSAKKVGGSNETPNRFGGLDKKFRAGLPVSHIQPELAPSRPDKDKIEAGMEKASQGLNRQIKDLLKKFKFEGQFKLTVSYENKGNYICKLLVPSSTSKKLEIVVESEDRPENILPRLDRYLQDK